jgi:ATP-dependent Clp protease ATP-binding subunit ClpC
MHLQFNQFLQRRLSDFNIAVVNLFMWMPHFFSVEYLLKTLFQPWKNIITVKKTPGFSFQEFFQRTMDNIVSRLMGFFARISIVSAYLTMQVLFLIFLPFTYLFLFVSMPLYYFLYLMQPTEEEQKKQQFDKFMKAHLVDNADTQAVTAWFESYYNNVHKKPWWTLERLMEQLPLGRDLTSGYTPHIDSYSDELTKVKPHYVHLVGRKKEIDAIQQVLCKSAESNIIISGQPGTGRKTIVEALAKTIYEGRSNPLLAFKRVLLLDMEKILANETDEVAREAFLSELFNEAEQAKNIILVIDNIEKYISKEAGSVDLTPLIGKYAQLPTLQFIGITTPYHYQKYIQGNRSFVNYFEKIDVQEISYDETLAILLDEALVFEQRYNMFITYESVRQAVVQSGAYINDRPYPEKAIQLLDQTCVVAQQNKEKIVTAHLVNAAIETITHIPTELSSSFKEKLLNVEKELHARIVSQDEAIKEVAAALRKSFVLVGSHKKPISSFLFLGPTGVGKTETAKAITQTLFDHEQNMMRFDMSTYQTIEGIATLIGSPESGEPGLLSQAVRQQKYGTLLLDELEKAHKDLLNIFLTILDEGYFIDGFGNRVDCTHLIIIATSNAGADFIYQALSANDAEGVERTLSKKLVDYLVAQHIFSPEFLNRFDGVIIYRPLQKDAIYLIAQRLLNNLQADLLKTHGLTIEFSHTFIDKLIQQGYDARFGARNMQRIIQNEVEDKIAKMLLSTPNIKNRTLIF